MGQPCQYGRNPQPSSSARIFAQPRRKLLAIALLALIGFGAAAPSAFAGDTTYKYDSLGRVIEVTESNGRHVKYFYDAAGNRTEVVSFVPRRVVVLPLAGFPVLVLP